MVFLFSGNHVTESELGHLFWDSQGRPSVQRAASSKGHCRSRAQSKAGELPPRARIAISGQPHGHTSRPQAGPAGTHRRPRAGPTGTHRCSWADPVGTHRVPRQAPRAHVASPGRPRGHASPFLSRPHGDLANLQPEGWDLNQH